MFVPQSRPSRYNIHRERVVPKDVKSHSLESCKIEETCQIPETREAVGTSIQIRENCRRSDDVYGLGLGRLQGN